MKQRYSICKRPGPACVALAVATFTLVAALQTAADAEPAQTYRLTASSYMDGGSGRSDRRGSLARDVAIDKDGNIYVVGGTVSADFPVTRRINPPKRGPASSRPDVDVFVMKLDPRGRILWSVRLGGPNHDRAYAVEVDPRGYVYVAGRAGAGYPTTEGVIQPNFGGGYESGLYGKQDGFVSKISPDGGTLVWSTYFGAQGHTFIRDIDVDARGQVYIGATNATVPLPHITPNAFQKQLRGTSDAVYAKLSADGRKVLYATYLGGAHDGRAGDGQVPSVRVDGDGNVFFLAFTDADDLPVTANAVQPRLAGKNDLMIAKFAADGRLLYLSYLGGSDEDMLETHHLALDRAGNPVITCATRSKDFPVTAGAFQTRHAQGGDAVIAKLSSDGSRLLAATYLGGAGNDVTEGVTVAANGDIVLSGGTESDDFPVTPGALQKRRAGDMDFFIARLTGNLSKMVYASFFGGSRRDSGRSVAISPGGDIVVAGETRSADFPVVNGFDTKLNGGRSGAFIKLSP